MSYKSLIEIKQELVEEKTMDGLFKEVVKISAMVDKDELLKAFLHAEPLLYAEPVKHGKWIREPNCWYRCSECGSHYPSIQDNMNYRYCPNCGAKMVGNENDSDGFVETCAADVSVYANRTQVGDIVFITTNNFKKYIPVEWIKKWIKTEPLGIESLVAPEYTIETMLHCWEKER